MTRPNIQSALYGLWFNHYTTATDEQRSLLVQEFIDEYLQDVSPAAAKAIKAKHPAHYRRGESPAKYRLYPVAEILADFIIRAEDDASGLTASPQTQENRKNARNKNEVHTEFTDRFDDEEGFEDKPAGLQTEFDVYKGGRDLYPDFTAEVELELTIDEFRAMIERIKASAEKYAEMYVEKYGKDYRETLRRIKRLDIKRIAICEECSEVFYKHDMRRKYCDLRPSCEANAKKRRENNNYRDKRSEKVKVSTKCLHYVIEGSAAEVDPAIKVGSV